MVGGGNVGGDRGNHDASGRWCKREHRLRIADDGTRGDGVVNGLGNIIVQRSFLTANAIQGEIELATSCGAP